MKALDGLHAYYHVAEKKGYSGVGLWCRREPDDVKIGLGNAEFDAEGRYLQADFGKLSVVSLYLPSGSSSPGTPGGQVPLHGSTSTHTSSNSRGAGAMCVVCGDWNIAHREIDLEKLERQPQELGFPARGARLDRARARRCGWSDVYRRLHPETTDACYTWWSNRGQAWAKNVGWRIDYQLATPALAATARSASIHQGTALHRSRTTDHRLRLCALNLRIDLSRQIGYPESDGSRTLRSLGPYSRLFLPM